MLDLYKNIKSLRLSKELSQEQLAAMTGYKDRTSIAKIEAGKVDLSQSKIIEFAKALGVSPSYLMGWNSSDDVDLTKIKGIIPIKKLRRIPILGQIACGNPILAEENYIGYFTADDKYLDSDFCLYAKGDSMTGAEIDDGDLVFIKKQSDVDDGEIAAVLIDDEATLKRVYKIADKVQLRADNPHYPPIDLDGTQTVIILGKATHVLRPVK
ncbi:helix-turn-helix domain-containing protein [Aedoeadaptatus acetigenes]|uniref:helix-turn-helix domain-containing protein n=1 Tax=Aedoeadaptatus acetigenes TaxID=2981723 RepID=UPI002265F25F|nr:S24 family peptidase [Aedoeadaptatus acetigenes]MCU6786377.1 helix-turn-helix domain-containing protein [Aedoeadaptatus acetigenes]